MKIGLGLEINRGVLNTGATPTPPSAPTATAATSVLYNSLSANWNASSGATGYKLWAYSDAGRTTPVPGFNGLDVGNVLTYQITGLTAYTLYYYDVKAYNGAGDSGFSNLITQRSNLATPSFSSVSSLKVFGYTANWSAITGATKYYIDLSIVSNFASFISGWENKDVGGVTTYAISDFVKAHYGQNIYARIRATDGTLTSASSSTQTTTLLLFLDYWTGAQRAFMSYKMKLSVAFGTYELRRVSDNAVKTFYSDDNYKFTLNSTDGSGTSLSSWIGSGSATLRTYYDKSGNSYNFTQTTTSAQPLIVNSGVLIEYNAASIVRFDGSAYQMTASAPASYTNKTIFLGIKAQNNAQDSIITAGRIDANNLYSIGLGDSGTNARIGLRNRVGGVTANTGEAFSSTSFKLITAYIATSPQTQDLYIDGIIDTQAYGARNPSATNNVFLGSAGGSNYYNGDIMYMISFDTDKRSDINAINLDLNKLFAA